MRLAFARMKEGNPPDEFSALAGTFDPRLFEDWTIEEEDLRAAWNYAEDFFFRLYHKDPKFSERTWAEAGEAYQQVTDKLEAGVPIPSWAILRGFQHP
jgi:hypothetical protein